MNKKYELIIFDVDGTLLDTTEGILQAVRYTIQQKGLPLLKEAEMLQFIGPPIQDSFQKFYGIGGDELQKTAETFRDYYKDKSLLLAKPYDGVYEVLNKLKESNIIIAVATYKRQDYARKLLQYYEFDKYSSLLYGADHYNKLKKTDIINKCIEKAKIKNKERVLMVGDSRHDAVGAEMSVIDFLGVTYGFGYKSKEEVQGTHVIGACDKITELLDYVL